MDIAALERELAALGGGSSTFHGRVSSLCALLPEKDVTGVSEHHGTLQTTLFAGRLHLSLKAGARTHTYVEDSVIDTGHCASSWRVMTDSSAQQYETLGEAIIGGVSNVVGRWQGGFNAGILLLGESSGSDALGRSLSLDLVRALVASSDLGATLARKAHSGVGVERSSRGILQRLNLGRDVTLTCSPSSRDEDGSVLLGLSLSALFPLSPSPQVGSEHVDHFTVVDLLAAPGLAASDGERSTVHISDRDGLERVLAFANERLQALVRGRKAADDAAIAASPQSAQARKRYSLSGRQQSSTQVHQQSDLGPTVVVRLHRCDPSSVSSDNSPRGVSYAAVNSLILVLTNDLPSVGQYLSSRDYESVIRGASQSAYSTALHQALSSVLSGHSPSACIGLLRVIPSSGPAHGASTDGIGSINNHSGSWPVNGTASASALLRLLSDVTRIEVRAVKAQPLRASLPTAFGSGSPNALAAR